MKVHRVTPILNVSELAQSFAWFEKLGWKKLWDWGTPPDFGACRGRRGRCTCAILTATCSA